MIISIIVAMDQKRVIGLDNKLPWHIPAELQHFKDTTMGKPIIMGRKTFDAIGRRLLPGRTTIVLTQDENLVCTGFKVAHSVLEALQAAGDVSEVVVIGGANVYREFLPLAQRIYMTVVDGEHVGDTFFPQFDEENWHIVSQKQYEGFVVKILER
jgi:dihydrofolate reductase